MAVRPFDWRDLALLQSYRNQSVYLDSALLLTRGPLVMPGAVVSFLAPGVGVFTAMIAANGKADRPLIGQIIHQAGSPFAYLTFLAPDASLAAPKLNELIDYLIAAAGERGALRLLADVDDHAETYEALRQANFSTYARQRVWEYAGQAPGREESSCWRRSTRQDALAIRLLYNNLVPGLVQQIEPYPPAQISHGMVFQNNNDLLAYVEMRSGRRGVWVHPFFHPGAEDVSVCLASLFQTLERRYRRPLYICVRSYQSWLEPVIEELGAQPGPRQAVMVRHLVGLQKVARPVTAPVLEGGRAEPTAPIVQADPLQRTTLE
jgi:hypothetical protein